MKNKIIVCCLLLSMNHFGVTQNTWYNVLEFGAVNNGEIISTKSIQKAIDHCAENGGGIVCFPAGKYISGTLFLKSFVTLHLESGAILRGSTNIGDYPVTVSNVRSYSDNYTDKSLIYAEGNKNISITGRGIIDGNGGVFKIARMINDDNIRKKDDWAFYKTRPFIIRMINCKNILIRDVTILNSPMWVQHYLLCEDVLIDGITVKSRVNKNNDGIDIDGCNSVRISNCDIFSGDDAIVLKSTLDRPCKNITVSNCILSSDCSAFKLGTESNGDFENISFSNSTIYDTRLAGIALEMVDGGSLHNVSISGVNIDSVGCAVFIRLGNRARPFKEDMSKPGTGSLYNVIIRDIQATNTGNIGCSVTGLPSNPATDITLSNIRIGFQGGGTKYLVTRQIEELPEKYPEFNMFGMLPAYGFFCRHIDRLKLENIDLTYDLPDYRPALYFKDIKNSIIDNLNASGEIGTESIIHIDNSQFIVIQGCNLTNGSQLLSSIKNNSKAISFINNNDFNNQTKLFSIDNSIKISEITVK